MQDQNMFPFPLDIQFFAEEDDDDADDDKIEESEVEEEESESEQEEGEPAAKAGDDGKPKTQTRAENAFFAQKRREAEKAAKEKAEKENREKERAKAYREGKIAGLGGVNPYTEEKMETDYDLHIYEVMKSIDEKGGDPVKGLAKALSEERRRQLDDDERAKKAQEDAVEAAKRNIEELGKAYPAADRAWFEEAYRNDSKFRSMCDHGFTPKEAYEMLGYDKAEPDEGERKTPSSASGGAKKEQSVLDMDDEKFLKQFRAKYN